MNVPEMHALADFLETLPHLEPSGPHRHAFDLATYLDWHAASDDPPGPACRSIGCIAGSYYVLRQSSGPGAQPPTSLDVSDWAANGLGLTPDETYILFTPEIDWLNGSYRNVTPAQAARVIRQAVSQHQRFGTFDDSIWDCLQAPA